MANFMDFLAPAIGSFAQNYLQQIYLPKKQRQEEQALHEQRQAGQQKQWLQNQEWTAAEEQKKPGYKLDVLRLGQATDLETERKQLKQAIAALGHKPTIEETYNLYTTYPSATRADLPEIAAAVEEGLKQEFAPKPEKPVGVKDTPAYIARDLAAQEKKQATDMLSELYKTLGNVTDEESHKVVQKGIDEQIKEVKRRETVLKLRDKELNIEQKIKDIEFPPEPISPGDLLEMVRGAGRAMPYSQVQDAGDLSMALGQRAGNPPISALPTIGQQPTAAPQTPGFWERGRVGQGGVTGQPSGSAASASGLQRALQTGAERGNLETGTMPTQQVRIGERATPGIVPQTQQGVSSGANLARQPGETPEQYARRLAASGVDRATILRLLNQ